MKMAIGDIADRYAICKLKSERLNLDNSQELLELDNEIKMYEGITSYVDSLYAINGMIWDLESDIRKGNESILGLEEVGRRAIQIREYNGVRVGIKNDINSKYNEGFVEVKMNHGSEKEPTAVITLTTVPERLSNDREDGLKLVLTSLCEQTDNSYEVHFNVPNIYNLNKQEYVIPDWLNSFKLKYKHLKVFRTEDFGPPTKFVPSLQRIKNKETILIVVDDDLVYHPEMVAEHRKYQAEFTDCVICYDGRGSELQEYGDIRDSWVLCVTHPRETHGIQHYKSASYKVKLFNEDFYTNYLPKTLSDDVLVSRYFRDYGVKMYSVPYEKEVSLYETRELWDIHQGVTSFPILRYASSVEHTGCNNPELLKLQPKFYDPFGSGTKKTMKFNTDKYNHGYVPVYEKYFNSQKDSIKNVLEIGVYQGDSLRYWKSLFPNALVCGADINDCTSFEEENIKIYILNQDNRQDILNFANSIDYNFDVIIDDGGHTMKQQQKTFGILFSKLAPGGTYIIEDLHTSDKSQWMDADDQISTLNMIREFKNNNYIQSNNITDEEKKYLESNIESIEIWSRTATFDESVTSFIKKKLK